MAADDTLIQAMRVIVMQQQIFYNVDHIPVICCNLLFFSLTNMNRI